MKVIFWGVRGSIPCPGPTTTIYGGNTACIELRMKELDRIIIIDAGSGIRKLGQHIVNQGNSQNKIDIFLTHTHWDHIAGLPFFAPAYLPQSSIRIYGPVSSENCSLETLVGGQMSYHHFPVCQNDLAADFQFISLKEEEIDLGSGLSLKTKFLNHPIFCLGYRFTFNNRTVCTAYDTEPFRNLFTDSQSDQHSIDSNFLAQGEAAAQELNQQLTDFYSEADLLIHDCQYTKTEYEAGKQGWGHSWFEYVGQTAAKAKVKKTALFHHDPDRTDNDLKKLEEFHGTPQRYGNVEIFCAREGMEVDL